MANKQNEKNGKKKSARHRRQQPDVKETWKPKTALGKKVKAGEITDIKQILDSGEPIIEPEIVEILLPNAQTDLLLIGQSKGKFGGGRRRAFRQTQKKTKEGNVISFASLAVVGNNDGYIGIGSGKSKETIPAREKAFRQAKLNLIKMIRGCGSWQCSCKTPHSIPFSVHGKCGSTEITLVPAPKGTGLCVEKECQKVLRLAGIKDVWSRTKGQTKIKLNLIYALFDALKQLVSTKTLPKYIEQLGIVEGSIGNTEINAPTEDELGIALSETEEGNEKGKKEDKKNQSKGRTESKTKEKKKDE
ncbi:30S ribosomal protein S5 [Candidatus Woesearchaeota archaeon]|nr:30S ribosomal protein S5 [Candidatus Woesearchaeota archaeon]